MSRLLGLCLVLLLLAPCASGQPSRGPLLVLLLPGTTLSDWQRAPAPNLHRLLATGAVAVMNTRTARLPNDHVRESPQSAVLTLGAGARAAGGAEVTDFHPPGALVPGLPLTYGELYARRMGKPPPPGRWINAGWPRVLAENQAKGYDLLPGNLGDALCRLARAPIAGGGAYSLPVATDSIGTVSIIPARGLPQRLPSCLIWDAGADPGVADRLVGTAAAETAAQGGRLLLVSPFVRDAEYAAGRRLAPVLLWWPGIPPGLLFSPSTHRARLVADTDFAPTVLALLGVPRPESRLPSLPIGRAWQTRPVSDGVTQVARLERDAYRQAAALQVLPAIAIALGGIVLLGIAFSQRGRLAGPLAVTVTAVIFALAVSPSLWVGLAVISAVGVTVWLLRAQVSLMRVIFSLDALLVLALVVDTCRGNPLMTHSLLGYSAVEGARFYGIGNEAMGALIGATLVCGASLWTERRSQQLGLMTALAAIALMLGLPTAGAKAGGLLVAVAAFSFLVWTLRRGRWRARSVFTVLLLMTAGLAAAALGDWRRHDAQQTHFGQALGRVQAGGIGEAADIARRKLVVEGRLLYHSAWALPLWASVLGLLSRRRRNPDGAVPRSEALWAGGSAAILTSLVLNDAGVVAAALCGSLVWSGRYAANTEKGPHHAEDGVPHAMRA